MTTEDKALALVNEVCAEWEVNPATEDDMDGSACFSALTRAIEAHEADKAEHEAFAQRVSDAVGQYERELNGGAGDFSNLRQFIIAKPDPLVEAMSEAMCGIAGEDYRESAEALRAALASRGLEIRKVGE